MRTIRIRFTARWLMVAIAIAAVGMGMERTRRYRLFYHKKIIECKKRELSYKRAARYWYNHAKLFDDPPKTVVELREREKAISNLDSDCMPYYISFKYINSMSEEIRHNTANSERSTSSELLKLADLENQKQRKYKLAAWFFWETIPPDLSDF
jgi:hypothetical protein